MRTVSLVMAALAVAAAAIVLADRADAAASPQIRVNSQNTVPACVTPPRLWAFLKARNPAIEPRFKPIAEFYKQHGEAWRVRWDYAFFQMALETNFLSFTKGNGRSGDVKARQNNFAGLGTTGRGVPGDSYPSISTGVLAQIQHLVVYSGERIAEPVGARTRLKQDDIIETMARLNRAATFADLSRRWAADRSYGASIEWVARNYRETYCTGREAQAAVAEPSNPARSAKAIAGTLAAVALGGPAHAQEAAREPPVRTIWSREKQRQQAEQQSTPESAPDEDAAVLAPQGDAPESVAVQPDPAAQPQEGGAVVFEPQEASDSLAVSAVPQDPPAEQPDAQAEGPVAFAFAGGLDVDAIIASPTPRDVAGSARCRVLSASYGGQKTLLVRSFVGDETRYTALSVLDGFERSMLENFISAHAQGGSSVGEFETREAALARARALCPGAGPSRQRAGAAAN